jgi:hypothetical protein
LDVFLRFAGALPLIVAHPDWTQSHRRSHFRNSIDLRDKVEMRTLRKRLKLVPVQLDGVVRKAGNSITAISKEAKQAERSTK